MKNRNRNRSQQQQSNYADAWRGTQGNYGNTGYQHRETNQFGYQGQGGYGGGYGGEYGDQGYSTRGFQGASGVDTGYGGLASGSMYGQSGRTGHQGGYSDEHSSGRQFDDRGQTGYGMGRSGPHQMERQGYGQAGYGQSRDWQERGYQDRSYPNSSGYQGSGYRGQGYGSSGYGSSGYGGGYQDSGSRGSGYGSGYESGARSWTRGDMGQGMSQASGARYRSEDEFDRDNYQNDYPSMRGNAGRPQSNYPDSGRYGHEGSRGWESGGSSYGQSGYGQGYGQTYGQNYGQSGRGKAPKNYKKSDDRIRDDVSERLIDDGYDCSEVEVNCQDGLVTLSGECCDRGMKHGMEHAASDVHGVKDVQNQLRVKSRNRSEEIEGKVGSGWSGSTSGPESISAGSTSGLSSESSVSSAGRSTSAGTSGSDSWNDKNKK